MTVTLTVPATPGGVVALIWLALTYCTFVASADPKRTVAALVNDVPVTVTTVPPAVLPDVGVTPVTENGAGLPNV